MTEPDITTIPARLPFRVVLASMVGLWLCYFLLTTLRGSIVGLEMQDELLWRRGLVSLAGVVVTFVMWLVLRLFDERQLWAKIVAALLVALPAAVLIAQANQMVFADIEAKVIEKIGARQGVKIRRDEAGNVLVDVPGLPGELDDPQNPPERNIQSDKSTVAATVTLARAPTGLDRWRQLTDIALGRYFLLLAWASLYLALLAGAQARAAERREGEFRRAAKASELRSLRYQVNPHFLFNALNSLSALVLTGKVDRAETMIQTISNFYRHSLADDPTSDVCLADEFALQRHYLDIEAVRFPDRLRPVFDLPDNLAEARIPGMIMQPLVENSVKYAIGPSKVPVTVTLAAREEYGRLVVSVSDNGPGANAESKHGFGIGLANVRDRLKARFGKDATIVSGSTAAGYLTELRIPMVKHG
ncbi:sensor histidine kinase [Altererythrobacter confluentis]|uniref:Sensor histidine kinase n=1 Tax=Allopontixanthobacter confluentis TaxID=1849021 RepID=A0A6L7GIA7_9SPHN|nr:histidine kinase [Allopontixanthobacter confluentis]MXP15246.1 sensor histidine kinase [Allopontixanthobacter confluentis]